VIFLFFYEISSFNSFIPKSSSNSQFLIMSERTGLSVSQVTDEVLYTGLIEMQELPELVE